MNRRQVSRFWDELDRSASVKDAVSALANKKGFRGKRTLERYAHAANGFRQGLPSEDVAEKTGWSVGHVDEIRVWWNERASSHAQPEQRLHSEISHEQQNGESERLIALIEKWRTELESYAPGQIARLWLEESSKETAYELLCDEGLRRVFREAKRTHLRNRRPRRYLLDIESAPGFRVLRQKFPTSAAWTHLEVWAEQAIPYVSLLWDLLNDLRMNVERLRQAKNISTNEVSLLFTARRMVCLEAVAVACNLLAQGLGELPADVRHGLLVGDLEKLQAEVQIQTSLLVKRGPESGVAAILERIWADPNDTGDMVLKTKECLSKWHELQSTQDLLLIAIQEMEDSI